MIDIREKERDDIEALNLVAELVDWADYMGGWDSPCWDRARAFVGRGPQS